MWSSKCPNFAASQQLNRQRQSLRLSRRNGRERTATDTAKCAPDERKLVTDTFFYELETLPPHTWRNRFVDLRALFPSRSFFQLFPPRLVGNSSSKPGVKGLPFSRCCSKGGSRRTIVRAMPTSTASSLSPSFPSRTSLGVDELAGSRWGSSSARRLPSPRFMTGGCPASSSFEAVGEPLLLGRRRLDSNAIERHSGRGYFHRSIFEWGG